MKECQSKLQNIATNELKFSNMLSEQKVTGGTLKQQLHDYEKKIIQRNDLLNAALTAWKLDPIDKNISESDIVASINIVKEKQGNFDRKLEEDTITRKREEKGLQNNVDQLRSTKSKIESEMNLHEKQASQIREEISQNQGQILQIGQATASLNLIESKLEDVNNKVEQVTKSVDIAAVKKNIREKIDLREMLMQQLTELNGEIASLREHSSVLAELELHKSSLVSKEHEFADIRKKRGEDVKKFLGVK